MTIEKEKKKKVQRLRILKIRKRIIIFYVTKLNRVEEIVFIIHINSLHIFQLSHRHKKKKKKVSTGK